VHFKAIVLARGRQRWKQSHGNGFRYLGTEEVNMKSFFAGCVAAVILALIGSFVLNSIQEPADKAFSTNAVRLGV
jgi:hypothetical protein